ncbi:MAG: M6 family metalloprotease domain-containing protein [Bacteroidaceae bacterium]|nr:M6 family metalloprotease domain-containing protein [Bacteroidaceae bacterium]
MNRLKHLLLLLMVALLCHTAAYAIKAHPRSVVRMLPDGTTIALRIHGDENFHYLTTLDGYPVRQTKDGFFRYLRWDAAKGKFSLTRQRARDAHQRTEDERTLLAGITPVRKADLETIYRRAHRRQPAQILSKAVVAPKLQRGATAAESQYLVILVNFKDRAFAFANEDFVRWLNEPGYSENGGTGSVKDYYRDNSMGMFVPNFKVIGPVTLEHNQDYYAGNDEDTGEDIRPREMVIEACRAAKATHPELDFAQFDNDGDGFMDNINIVYAGYSEASTGSEDDMWPHSWYLGADSINVDGITLNNYSCSAELVGASGIQMDGIGTFTHEFGHILGLKDMYDTDEYVDGYGLDPGTFSLYASGSYNNDSRTPPCLMAFERMQMGWCSPTPLSGAEDVALQPIHTNEARYINAQPHRTPGTGHEWFVLENRQQTGWDKYIPAHGLLIYHYDYTDEMVERYWSVNGPNNNARHRCMYIVPADNVDDINSRNADTYPGRTGNTSFTDTTLPSALNWAGYPTNTPITNIREEGGVVYFQVCGGVQPLSTIRTLVPTNIRDTSMDVAAIIETARQEVNEAGFCWAIGAEPSLNDEHVSVTMADTLHHALTGLKPGCLYNIRSYMKMSDGSIVYGAAIPVNTECAIAEAPYVGDFTAWTDGQPDCWKIVDNNGDGTTWVFDDNAQGMLYQFDYWNNADDWLISCRMKVPENGALYFIRGVVDETTVENLDVYVSTLSREIKDFHLVKRFSFADNFGQQMVEEVDLKNYAGQEIYIAFVCKSEKLQTNLWIWQVYLTQKLQRPEITTFEKQGNQLQLEWKPVENATKYYLEFSERTNDIFNKTVFIPESDFVIVDGSAKASTGVVDFWGDGYVETRSYPDGITNCMFILTSSGPLGNSVLTIEGTEDGVNWETVGPITKVSEYNAEGTEHLLTDYLVGKSYRKLRLSCKYGGRNIRVRYFTLSYNDGLVENILAEGSVNGTGINIEPTTPGEFEQGKTYVARVYAGDGFLFYDASAPAVLQTPTTGLNEVAQNTTLRITQQNGNITISGLKGTNHITCHTPAGALIYRTITEGNACTFRTPGYTGMVIINVKSEQKEETFKHVVR